GFHIGSLDATSKRKIMLHTGRFYERITFINAPYFVLSAQRLRFNALYLHKPASVWMLDRCVIHLECFCVFKTQRQDFQRGTPLTALGIGERYLKERDRKSGLVHKNNENFPFHSSLPKMTDVYLIINHLLSLSNLNLVRR